MLCSRARQSLSVPELETMQATRKRGRTQRYAHVADDPLREAAHKIGSVIAGAGEDGADVVAFPKRGPSA